MRNTFFKRGREVKMRGRVKEKPRWRAQALRERAHFLARVSTHPKEERVGRLSKECTIVNDVSTARGVTHFPRTGRHSSKDKVEGLKRPYSRREK